MMLTTDPPDAHRPAPAREPGVHARGASPTSNPRSARCRRATSTRSPTQRDADLIADYAALLPMDVISKLLGVPDGDQEQLREWSDALLHREEGVPDVTPAGIEAATHLYKYFSAFVADRRARSRRPTTSPPRSSRPRPTAKRSPTSRSSASASC